MKKVYAAMINGDMTEGRGPMRIMALFTHQGLAKELADSHEPYARSGQFNTVQEYVLFESRSEYENHLHTSLRESGLRKLTNDEKKALGLI